MAVSLSPGSSHGERDGRLSWRYYRWPGHCYTANNPLLARQQAQPVARFASVSPGLTLG
jgi:hypothetical protein